MRKLLLCLGFLFVAHDCATQQLQLTNYSQKGVPVYGVNGIFQDSRGWMWFTSGYEVIRYDGNEFKTYSLSKGASMDFCFQVFEVGKEMWVNANPSMLKIMGDSLYLLDLEERGSKMEINYYLSFKNRSFFLGRLGLYELQGKALQPYIVDSTLRLNQNEVLIPWNDSILISYRYGRSLIAYNINSREYFSVDMPVREMKLSNGKICMLIKAKGIFQLENISFSGKEISLRTIPVCEFSNPNFTHFVVDGHSNTWVYDQFRELIKITPSGQTHSYNESHGLPSLWFTELFLDREKNVWIGFNGGLCKIRNTNWERYTAGESLYSNHILFIANGPSAGTMITGTQNGVNMFADNTMRKLYKGKDPFHCSYMEFYQGRYYFLRDSGFYSCDINAVYQVSNEKRLATFPGNAHRFTQDSRGNFYINTSKGLFAWIKGQQVRLIPDSSYYRALLIDQSNRIWAGEFAGILHCYELSFKSEWPYLKKIFSIDTISSGLPPVRSIRSVAADKKGNIFVGTRYNGLFILRVENGKPVLKSHLTDRDGMSSNTVWNMAVDQNGDCWVANMKGLIRLVNENDNWKLIDEGTKRQLHYSLLVTLASDSSIWVANPPGLTVIRTNEPIKAGEFSVFINRVTVNGKRLDSLGYQKFSFRKNNFSIDFSANSYQHEEAMLYSWRLHENDEWSKASSVHQVNYSALKPGKYEFSVRAVDPEGNLSLNEDTFQFRIMAPFWQQAWFIAGMLVLMLLVVFAIYRYRLRRIRELYEIRNSIARDLHDEIGSTLTSINVLSKVSFRNLRKDDEKAGAMLEKVIEQSQQIQQSMSDIVWAIKPDNDRMENMAIRMREYLSHTLEPHNFVIQFMVDETVLEESLTMHQRRDFFLIFKEAINNIAKYSRCTEATIKLTKVKDSVILIIADNGIGFDTTKKLSSAGLVNMQRRTEFLKGELIITSFPGKGSEIRLTVPAT